MQGEFNLRQLMLMREALDDGAPASVQALGTLVNKLEALNAALVNPGESWDQAFFAAWVPLEEVYAIVVDDYATSLNPEQQALIRHSIENLKQLIREVTVDKL